MSYSILVFPSGDGKGAYLTHKLASKVLLRAAGLMARWKRAGVDVVAVILTDGDTTYWWMNEKE